LPKSNTEFWKNKFQNNVRRDIEKSELLIALGWTVLIIWECELKKEVIQLTFEKLEKTHKD